MSLSFRVDEFEMTAKTPEVNEHGDDEKHPVEVVHSLSEHNEMSSRMPYATKAPMCEEEPPRDWACCLRELRDSHPWIYWYIAPMTSEFHLSLFALVFHFINFLVAICYWVWLVTSITTTVSLIVVACVGLPLLWLAMEIQVWFTRVHVWFCSIFDGIERPCFDSKAAPANILSKNRIKWLFGSLQLYKVLFFYLLVNPLVVLFTAWSDLLAVSIGTFLVSPLLYAIGGREWFRRSRFCIGTGSENKNTCDGYSLNNWGNILLFALVALLLMPLCFRLCIVTGHWALRSTTYFCVDSDKHVSLLGHKHRRASPAAKHIMKASSAVTAVSTQTEV